MLTTWFYLSSINLPYLLGKKGSRPYLGPGHWRVMCCGACTRIILPLPEMFYRPYLRRVTDHAVTAIPSATPMAPPPSALHTVRLQPQLPPPLQHTAHAAWESCFSSLVLVRWCGAAFSKPLGYAVVAFVIYATTQRITEAFYGIKRRCYTVPAQAAEVVWRVYVWCHTHGDLLVSAGAKIESRGILYVIYRYRMRYAEHRVNRAQGFGLGFRPKGAYPMVF